MSKQYITQICNECGTYQSFVYLREHKIEELNTSYPVYGCVVCDAQQCDNRDQEDIQRDLEQQNPLELNVQDFSQEAGEN